MITVMRSPLEDTTNSPSHSPTLRSTSPSLRHKSTQRRLNAHLDSSESLPSIHSSLYDASVQRETPHLEPEDTKNEWEAPPDLDLDESNATSWHNRVVDEEGNIVPASFLNQTSPERNVHQPCKLDPITEQNSLLTIRSRRSATSSLTPRGRSYSPAQVSKHKRSFSLSDLPAPIERSEQNASSDSASPPPPPSPLPQPNRPVQLPPKRSTTPPNVPTFGSPEALTYQLPPPRPKRFSDRFRIFTPEEQEWRRQTVALPRGVIMRGEDGTLVHGKFRPIRSGHMPPQRQSHAQMYLPDRAPHHREARRTGTGQGGDGRTEQARTPTANAARTQVEESRRISRETEMRDVAARKEGWERRRRWLRKVLEACCPLAERHGNRESSELSHAHRIF